MLSNVKNVKWVLKLPKRNDKTFYVTIHSFQEDTYQYLSRTKLPIEKVPLGNMYCNL